MMFLKQAASDVAAYITIIVASLAAGYLINTYIIVYAEINAPLYLSAVTAMSYRRSAIDNKKARRP